MQSFSHLSMAMAHLRAGRLPDAQRSAVQGTRHADACGYVWGAVACTWIGCKARIAAGDLTDETVGGLRRVVGDSALDRDLTSWLVGLVALAYAFLRRGDGARAAELFGIASRQGERVGYVPEAMDPVETREYVEQLQQAVEERRLTSAYERGRGWDPARATERAEELSAGPALGG
jgi:hypothetical protein